MLLAFLTWARWGESLGSLAMASALLFMKVELFSYINYGLFLKFEIDPFSLGCCISVFFRDSRLGESASEDPLDISVCAIIMRCC
jgi:hypothetical protein